MSMRSAALLAGLSLCLASGAARATTFDFSYTANGIDSSGVIMANLVSGNQYLATSITGTHGGAAIVGLSGYASADNFVFTSGASYVDFQGLSYDFVGGQANLFYSDGAYGFSGYGEVTNPPDPGGFVSSALPATNVSLSAVPIPASAPMFGAALLALGVLGYGAKRKAAAAG